VKTFNKKLNYRTPDAPVSSYPEVSGRFYSAAQNCKLNRRTSKKGHPTEVPRLVGGSKWPLRQSAVAARSLVTVEYVSHPASSAAHGARKSFHQNGFGKSRTRGRPVAAAAAAVKLMKITRQIIHSLDDVPRPIVSLAAASRAESFNRRKLRAADSWALHGTTFPYAVSLNFGQMHKPH
jgi:hypothetical protein